MYSIHQCKYLGIHVGTLSLSLWYTCLGIDVGTLCVYGIHTVVYMRVLSTCVYRSIDVKTHSVLIVHIPW